MTKRYEDLLLTPYVGDIGDQPISPGHERYLTYMPKDGKLMHGMMDSRRVESRLGEGITIRQSFRGDNCTAAMVIETYKPDSGVDMDEDIRYLITAYPQGNRHFSIEAAHVERSFTNPMWDAERQEIQANIHLERLDDALGQIQDLDQSHVVRLAEGKNLILSDFQQLTLLSEAVKRHSYDENLREVQILANTSTDGQTVNPYNKVSVVRRGQDDVYLTVQLADSSKLKVYAEGIPSRGTLGQSHYDIKEKLDMLNERMQQLTNNITPQSMMTAMSVERRRKRLEALETVRQDASKLTYSDIIDLDDPSLEEYPFEDILNSAVQNAIYNVSSEYRVDMELARQEEQSIDISDLSGNDVQNLEF